VKHFKVSLTNGRSETIRVSEPIDAETWLRAMLADGDKLVTLNQVRYAKTDVIGIEEVKARSGSTNMEGI
jgi:hypothetical protein